MRPRHRPEGRAKPRQTFADIGIKIGLRDIPTHIADHVLVRDHQSRDTVPRRAIEGQLHAAPVAIRASRVPTR